MPKLWPSNYKVGDIVCVIRLPAIGKSIGFVHEEMVARALRKPLRIDEITEEGLLMFTTDKHGTQAKEDGPGTHSFAAFPEEVVSISAN